mmetsp:Transcript_38450/g.62246  ORF Transcript_38450/g.62246 Transcript_38450/m.62246 type:complete len:99 (+) Transcript_38450:718-1014(+)
MKRDVETLLVWEEIMSTTALLLTSITRGMYRTASVREVVNHVSNAMMICAEVGSGTSSDIPRLIVPNTSMLYTLNPICLESFNCVTCTFLAEKARWAP